MKEIIEKYREQHKDVSRDWKVAMITKMQQDPTTFIDTHQDIDWLYDDAIYFLFNKSQTKVKNLAKRLGYEEIPCETCRKIIEHWNDSDEYFWAPEHADKFE